MSALKIKSISFFDPAPYVNRDLSLLEFQRRVLDQAENEKTPLLERVKFLAIFGSNMDEFFMLRVSGIRKRIGTRGAGTSVESIELPDELTATRTRPMNSMQMPCNAYTKGSCLNLKKRVFISWTTPN